MDPVAGGPPGASLRRLWLVGVEVSLAPGYYAAYLLDRDGNNAEALYRDVGNP